MKQLVFILLAFLLASCGATKRATYQEHTTTDYVNTLRLDSLFKAAIQRDSIYVHDKGDTVTKYVEKIRYQIKQRTDTLYRNILHRDTLYIERVDSVAVEKPYYIEKPVKWYNQGFTWLGKLCCLAAILWALFMYLKRKF